jgi:ABC-2 type transport system permease protein
MTAATITRSPSIPTTARTTFFHQVRAEWIKLTSVRSTPWIIGTTVLVMVGIALLFAWSMTMLIEDPAMAGGEIAVGSPVIGVQAAGAGVSFGQIVVAILGVMVISGEYRTGQIRSTLAASPTRLPVLAAKAVVVALVAFVTGLVAVALSALVTTPMLSDSGSAIDLATEGTVQSLLGVPLYLVLVALISLGIGTMLRSTAGGIAVAVVLFFVLPIIGQMITADIVQDIYTYLPSVAGNRLIEGASESAALTPWQGYAVAAGWAVASLAGAAALLRGRDA